MTGFPYKCILQGSPQQPADCRSLASCSKWHRLDGSVILSLSVIIFSSFLIGRSMA